MGLTYIEIMFRSLNLQHLKNPAGLLTVMSAHFAVILDHTTVFRRHVVIPISRISVIKSNLLSMLLATSFLVIADTHSAHARSPRAAVKPLKELHPTLLQQKQQA